MTIPRGFNSNPWIDAFSDNRSCLNTFSNCMTLADIAGDKENRLVIADFGDSFSFVKLKVYKGTSLETEIPFADLPCAITTIYTDFNVPRIPGLAVASGNQIYLYKNLRPFFKFCLPSDNENNLESDIWKTQSDQSKPESILAPMQLTKLLQDLSLEIGFSNLSTLSQKFLMLSNEEDKIIFLNTHKHSELKKQTVITSMTSLCKSLPDENGISCLVLATENCKVFILDAEAFTVVKEFQCPDVAIDLIAFGIYVVEYTIVITCRNGSIALIKPSETKILTELSAYSVGLAKVNDIFVISCMDSTLQAYNFKGKKQWSTNLIGPPLCMTLVSLKSLSLNLVAVSCQIIKNDSKSGSVLFYSGPHILHCINFPEPISAMTFGQYGLEEHALVTVSTLGKFSIKLLRRTAQFHQSENKCLESFYNQPHQIQLMVPKKSKIFIEQTLRERNEFKIMHGIFQKSLLQLNIESSQMYLKALTNSSVTEHESFKLNHQILGLGPKLKIRIQIKNVSKDKLLSNLGITFTYDPSIHDIKRKFIQVPLLTPGLEVCLESDVICLASVSSRINIILFDKKVLLCSVINMPMAASLEDQ